ncbi:MAG: hypothetical protein WBJ84_07015 [Bacteroidales bacterium]
MIKQYKRKQLGNDNLFFDVKEVCLLPMAGNRNNNSGSLNNAGSNGNYWSSTVNGINARNLNFNSSNANMNNNYRANGFSVRCLKDQLKDRGYFQNGLCL